MYATCHGGCVPGTFQKIVEQFGEVEIETVTNLQTNFSTDPATFKKVAGYIFRIRGNRLQP